ncbi:MAG TPA: response regulator transcription factor [Firmicutes bacterium]|nr:response regulator transcription factor [Bacillota bacterium]
MTEKILVVDDERPIAEILKYNLEKDGFEVIMAYDGQEALELVDSEQPDLIILDIMLPKKDGFTVCREIRSARQVPIIMLSAREAEIDKVLGLELGADDYVTKPFSAREVTARVKAILRRSKTVAPEVEESAQLRCGSLLVDLNRMEVFRSGQLIDLTYREFELLTYMMRRPGYVFSRQQLLDEVWGYDYVLDERTVDVTVRRLREKIELNPADPEYIYTKRGVGYYFKESSYA